MTLDEFNIILKESIEFINIFFENTKLNDEMETFGQDFLNSVERTLVTKI